MLISLALFILLLPLTAFFVMALFHHKLPRHGDWLATGVLGLSLAASLVIFGKVVAIALATPDQTILANWTFAWLPMTGHSTLMGGIMVDRLTAVMLVVVTLVSFLVHLFSSKYMEGDVRYGRYYCCLLLFTASMLALVLANNMLFLYMAWEMVGLSSYLLIGHWYEKKSASDAAIKAFITTRAGDVGMFIGIMICYTQTGSLQFADIFAAVANGTLAGHWQTIAGLGIFFGAMGKSAQFPLHVWLPDCHGRPDAGFGLDPRRDDGRRGRLPGRPHDADVRSHHAAHHRPRRRHHRALRGHDRPGAGRYQESPRLLHRQPARLHDHGAGRRRLRGRALPSDDPRLLQGRAVPGIGRGDPRHAPRAVDEQIRRPLEEDAQDGPLLPAGDAGAVRLPGLRRLLVQGHAILGETLAFARLHPGNNFLPIAGFVTAFLTAFYMFRQFCLTFTGKPRDRHRWDHAHDGPWQMLLPLIVLGVLSVVGGGFGQWFGKINPQKSGIEQIRQFEALGYASAATKQALAGAKAVKSETQAAQAGAHEAPALHEGAAGEHEAHIIHQSHQQAMMLSIVVALAGILFGLAMYFERANGKSLIGPQIFYIPFKPLYKLLWNKYFFDELYMAVFVWGTCLLARFWARFDRLVIDSVVNFAGFFGKVLAFTVDIADRLIVDDWMVMGSARITALAGQGLSFAQTGRVRQYLVFTVVGLVALGMFCYWIF